MYEDIHTILAEMKKEDWKKYPFGKPRKAQLLEIIPYLFTLLFIFAWIVYFFVAYGVKAGLWGLGGFAFLASIIFLPGLLCQRRASNRFQNETSKEAASSPVKQKKYLIVDRDTGEVICERDTPFDLPKYRSAPLPLGFRIKRWWRNHSK